MQTETGTSLVDIYGDTISPLLHLILFGKATPFLHNGTLTIMEDNGLVINFTHPIQAKLKKC